MPALRNPRWEAFARAVAIKGMGHAEAYRSIGGKSLRNAKGEAYIIARRPEVKKRIAELQDEAKRALIERTIYDKESVVRGLLENIHDAKRGPVATYQGKVVYMTDEKGEVLYDEAGQPMPVHKPDFQAINRGWELLGYELGMFPKQTKLDVRRQDAYDAMSVEEILAQAQQKFQELGWEIELSDLKQLAERAQGLDEMGGVVGAAESEPTPAE